MLSGAHERGGSCAHEVGGMVTGSNSVAVEMGFLEILYLLSRHSGMVTVND